MASSSYENAPPPRSKTPNQWRPPPLKIVVSPRPPLTLCPPCAKNSISRVPPVTSWHERLVEKIAADSPTTLSASVLPSIGPTRMYHAHFLGPDFLILSG